MKLWLCSYQPLDTANEEKEQSNMTILEAHLPSGYVVDTSVFEDLVEPDGLIKRVETKNDDTVAIIYFDHLKKESIQVVVNAYRIHEVAEKKPTPVIIYDYYDSGKRYFCVKSRNATKNINISFLQLCQRGSSIQSPNGGILIYLG